MIKISPQQYAKSLYQLLTEVAEDKQEQAIKQFVLLLKKNNHLHLGQQIIQAFGQVYCQAENIARVQVATAVELPADKLQQLQKQLESAINQKTEVQATTDASLVGGVKLQIDDTLIDGSLKRKINSLRINPWILNLEPWILYSGF